MITKYEDLKSDFKLPSKRLLELEKEQYRKYIADIKKVKLLILFFKGYKILIRKAKFEAKNIAHEIIHKQLKKIKVNVESEVQNLKSQNKKLQDALKKSAKQLKKYESKIMFGKKEHATRFTNPFLKLNNPERFIFEL